MSKRIRSKRFKSKKAKSKNAKSKRDYKKTMNRRRKNKIKKINKGGSSVIGQGAHGIVQLDDVSVSGYSRKACFARKIAKSDLTPDEEGAFTREFEILKRMNHSNIVKVFRMGSGVGLYFYLEFCNAGDLYHYIKNGQAHVNDDCLENSNDFVPEEIRGGGEKTMDKAQKNFVIQGILKGLNYIHLLGYIHSDIKPANILLTYRDSVFTPKIADFGFVTKSGSRYGGTFDYTPFECLVHTRTTQDFWGCGMTILEFITMNQDISRKYYLCLSTNRKHIDFGKLTQWGADLLTTLADADRVHDLGRDLRNCFAQLLLIPTRTELENYDITINGVKIKWDEFDNTNVYGYYADIRYDAYDKLCRLYDA